jgi:hypothetical protein
MTIFLNQKITKQMKVTALIPEEIIEEVKKYSGAKNRTEGLLIALNDYLQRQRLKKVIQKIERSPLEFSKDFTALKIRSLRRKS